MISAVRTAAIEALVQDLPALDDASIDAIGVDRRRLCALELLMAWLLTIPCAGAAAGLAFLLATLCGIPG
jgi:phosphate/sulfate permease